MRKYFSCKINGSKIFWPFILAWAILASLMVTSYMLSPAASEMAPTVFNWAYVGKCAFSLLSLLVALAIVGFWLFFCVRTTLDGISFDEERFEPTYETREYRNLCIKGVLLSTITLGIYTPWFFKKLTAWFADNTAYRTNFFEFHGRGSTLFTYIILLVIIPTFIYSTITAAIAPSYMPMTDSAIFISLLLCLLLIFIICIYEAVYIRWFIDMTYGRKRILSTTKGIRTGWFIFGQALLSIITLGLYLPMATVRIWRYYACRTVIGEDNVEQRMGFSLTPWRDYLFVLGQMLLMTITAGIYYPWAYARIMSRLVSQTYLEEIETPSEPMPKEYH